MLINFAFFLKFFTIILSLMVTLIAFQLFRQLKIKAPEASKTWRFLIIATFLFALAQILEILAPLEILRFEDLQALIKATKLISITIAGCGSYKFAISE